MRFYPKKVSPKKNKKKKFKIDNCGLKNYFFLFEVLQRNECNFLETKPHEKKITRACRGHVDLSIALIEDQKK